MVRRLSEFKQKLHPNAKLRAWYASHTFGGTTKAKSLKILGFSKQNFYYVAAGVGALLLIAAVAGGIGIKSSVRNARAQGTEQGYIGQQVVQSTTEVRTRTFMSNGETIVRTETSAYLTTFQRGGGIMKITTTNEKGESITVSGSLSIMMNSDGKLETVIFVASQVFLTDSNGVGEQTLVFGDPTVISSDGKAITTTLFDGIAVTTDSSGKTVTNAKPKPGATATASTTGAATVSTGTISTSPSTSASATSLSSAASTAVPTTASTGAATTATAASSAPPSSASPSSSAVEGGGGGGDEFEGEATFYAPGLGSCGTDATDADFVAALSKILFDATGATNSNNNPYCGRKALVKAAGGAAKLRRWMHDGNLTSGIESWEKSRNERWSRRSVVSTGRGGIGIPTPLRNESDTGSDMESPQIPGITPAPQMGPWKRQAGGGGVTITVVDRCPVCKQYDLDLSPAAYDVLGSADAGRIPIKWKWLD